MQVDLDRALEVARRAVERAAEVSLRHFGRSLEVERKADRSPVTIADRESEQEILRVILAAFPSHAILAEETGARAGGEAGGASCRWIVDPIDGTKGFTRGGSFWGPLVALEVDGEVVVGAMCLPVSGDVYWAARGRGAYRNSVRLRVSDRTRWSEATLSLGELGPLLSAPWGDAVGDLVRTAENARCYGDLMGAALVLTGMADAWIEAGVKPWDLGPSKILLEEAGGRFSDFTGAPRIDQGVAIGSNGPLHDHVLARIQQSLAKP